MKNHVQFLTNKLLLKMRFVGFISILAMGVTTLNAQVNFFQTLNADFNKGVVNNVVVASDNVYLQNSATDVGSWLTATVLPQTLAGHKTVSWNDRYVYMVGGFNNTSYVNTVYVATIQSGGITGWTALNALPTALRDPAVVIGTNTIYVMGGKNDTQVFNTIYYAAINTDGTIGAWQTSSVTLPVNLWGHTATYMMGAIYVIGGSSSLSENTALNTVYYAKVNALNTLSAFVAGTNLSTACNRHSTVTYNSKLYVLGGYNNSGTKANTVYIATPGLDGSTGAWSTGTNLPVAISNHSSVVTNGLITVMAGAVGATLSNTVYFANADAVSLAWSTSGNVLYDYTKDGSAFSGNGQLYYAGGANLSGTPIFNCRYANLAMTSNFVNHGVFVSNPFFELGGERIIDSIAFKKAYTAPANLQVTYRTAGSDGIWGNWTSFVTASPIILGITKQYLQYATILTGSTTFNSTFNEMKLTTQGTQLSGNLNSTLTFTKAASPYWATSDISFTGGTHTFQAGSTILFLPETGLYVGQANVVCNGTAVDSVKFLSYNSEVGKWDGIYFAPESDVSVSSQFNYTVISNAGFGSNDANLFCDQTNEPLLSNCNINRAEGTGIRLETSNLVIQNSKIQNGTGNGMYLYNSNPSLINSTITNNTNAGVYLSSATSLPNYSNTTISNNLYALFYPTVSITLTEHLGTLTLTNNTYNGVCLPGGDVESNYRWNSLSFPIIITNNLRVGKYYASCRLTIEPGNTIKMLPGKNIQIGFYAGYPYSGELYAIGGADSLITFTSFNGTAGGWEGLYFNDLSDSYSSTSVLDYCVVEKANAYNLYIENTNQPSINHCTIRNAVQDGIKFYGAYNTLTNSTVANNGRYPLYFSEVHTFPVLSGNTYSGNGINMIGFSGGSLTDSRTLQNDGIGYHILDN
ncbi:MAG: Kelch repeat-containing protein, partial [Bacteroidales bacterium]